MSHESPIKQRLNITFGKFGALKYTGNLDVAKIWERVLRRAELPILYTQGFNTRPRLQLATALPLGITSECEIIDVSLRERLPNLDDIPERLESVAPAGLRVYKAVEVPIRAPALQALVESARYRITIEDDIHAAEVRARIDEILAAERIIKVKVRKNKKRKTTYDLRPMIHALELKDGNIIDAHLAAGERGNLRPSDVMAEMGLDDVHFNVHRYALYIDEVRQSESR